MHIYTYQQKNIEITIHYTDSTPVTSYTKLLVNNFPNVKNKKVVDFGTGSGIFAILAEKMGALKVLAIDIREEIETIIKHNIENNNCKIIEYFDVRKQIFSQEIDVIICNPASLPNKNNQLPAFINGGKIGNDMINEMILFAKKNLKSNGEIYFLHTSLVPTSITNKVLEDNNFTHSIMYKKNLEFRPIYKTIINDIILNKSLYNDIEFSINNDIMYETVYLYRAIKK